MTTAKITSKGQAVIPKVIREHLGVKSGDRLDFLVLDDGEVVIRPAVFDVRQLKGLLQREGQRPVSSEEMNRAVRRYKGRMV